MEISTSPTYKAALLGCSMEELRAVYLEHESMIVKAYHDLHRVDKEKMEADPQGSRQTMIDHLLRVPVADEPISGKYSKKLQRQIKSMGGVKITIVEAKAKGSASSFLYTCGFTNLDGKELLIQNVHRSTLSAHAELLNSSFRMHKRGTILGHGHTIAGTDRKFVYTVTEPTTQSEAVILKALKMLEPTRLYGLNGFEVLLVIPVGVKNQDAPANLEVSREEALRLAVGSSVPGVDSLCVFKNMDQPGKRLRMCFHCQKTTLELQMTNMHKCGSCKRAFYCSKACQKAHWKLHKKDCATTMEERFQKAMNLDPVA